MKRQRKKTKNNLFRRFKILALSISVLFLNSCATVLSKSEYPVKIMASGNYTLDGDYISLAIFDINGNEMFRGRKMPKEVPLLAKTDFYGSQIYSIKILKPGYKPIVKSLNACLDSNYYFNLLYPLGFFIDYMSGAMWELNEKINLKYEVN